MNSCQIVFGLTRASGRWAQVSNIILHNFLQFESLFIERSYFSC